MTDQPAADAAAVAALTRAYQRQIQQQRAAIEGFIRRLWQSLGTYREQQIPLFTRQAVPVIIGAQQNVAASTAGYLAHYRQMHVGGAGRPLAVDVHHVTGAAVRNGTSPATVYERPFHLVWRQLGAGATPPDAIQAGADRAVQTALTDLQLTKTHTSSAVLTDDKTVTGYRRVLEGPHSCALCLVAATQRYHRKDLLPMHPGCDCSVAPLYGPDELVHDEALLAKAHAAVAAATGHSAADARKVDYRDFLVTHTHGEMGPVLTRRGAPFKGPNDL